MRRPTLKRFLILFVIPVLLIGIWMFNTVAADVDRICVCHVEDKDSGNGHVIEVDEDSLKGHLNHGDVQCTVDCETVVGTDCNISSEGECTEGTKETDN
jgi:hypothetical protein